MPPASFSSLLVPDSPSSSSASPTAAAALVAARKRPRDNTTAEERREARAERNRIAAQISRDRRKAQFAQLEARVAELEHENQQLRLGLAAAPSTLEAARDRENEELRERVRVLEQGWEAVTRALAAQGFTAIPPLPPSTISSPTSPTVPSQLSPTSAPSYTVPSHVQPTRHLAAGGRDTDLHIHIPNTTTTNNHHSFPSTSHHRHPPHLPSSHGDWFQSALPNSAPTSSLAFAHPPSTTLSVAPVTSVATTTVVGGGGWEQRVGPGVGTGTAVKPEPGTEVEQWPGWGWPSGEVVF